MTVLAEFFSDPNRVRPGDTDTTSQLAERICGDPTGLVVLPWRGSEGTMRWYVLAPTESLERVREVRRSAIKIPGLLAFRIADSPARMFRISNIRNFLRFPLSL